MITQREMTLCKARRRISIIKMRSHSNATDPTTIETPDVTPEIGTEDADVLDQEIVEDREIEIMIVERVVIEGIGEIILLVGEILTDPTDPEEIITGTMINATIDVGIILIPIRTTILTHATTKISIREMIMYRTRAKRNLNVARDQAAPAANTPKINLRFTFFFLLMDTNEILIKYNL